MNFIFLIKKIFRTIFSKKNLTLKKISNLFKCILFIILKKKPDLISHYPVRLVFNTGDMCQLKCPLCPTGRGENSDNKLMKFNDFQKIFDEAKDYLYEIDLHNLGEPFLNNEIFQMVKYAKSSGVRTNLSSNLNFQSNKILSDIIDYGLDELIVSIDGTTQESYSKYRISGNLETVISNLKEIIKLKKIKHSSTPRLIWQFLVMKHNEHEINEAKSLSKALGVNEINFRPIRYLGKEILFSSNEKNEFLKTWLPIQKKYHRYLNNRIYFFDCIFLSTTMVVGQQGDVSPCCGTSNKKFDSFGNALECGLLKIWTSQRYLQAREIVLKKDRSKNDFICSHCVKNGFVRY